MLQMVLSCVPGGSRVPVPESQIAGFLMSHSLGHLPLEFPIMPHIMPWNRASCLGCPQCGNPCDPEAFVSDLDLGSRNYVGIIRRCAITAAITSWSLLVLDSDRMLT